MVAKTQHSQNKRKAQPILGDSEKNSPTGKEKNSSDAPVVLTYMACPAEGQKQPFEVKRQALGVATQARTQKREANSPRRKMSGLCKHRHFYRHTFTSRNTQSNYSASSNYDGQLNQDHNATTGLFY